MGNFDDSIRYSDLENMTTTEFTRANYKGTLITSGGYGIKSASEGILENKFDLVAIGRPFIANYDLIRKIRDNLPLEEYKPDMLKSCL